MKPTYAKPPMAKTVKPPIDAEEIGSMEDMKSDEPIEGGEEESNDSNYAEMIANCSSPEELQEIITMAQAKLKELETVGSSETET